ncbi:MAG: hypothetical protein AAF639_44015, partial [Chloroflexota bacterium]
MKKYLTEFIGTFFLVFTIGLSALGELDAAVGPPDFDPQLHPGAQYFGEGHYVAPDDAAAGNGNNNASHRRVRVLEYTPVSV